MELIPRWVSGLLQDLSLRRECLGSIIYPGSYVFSQSRQAATTTSLLFPLALLGSLHNVF
ncbi:MAG TPA: hypothetical protein V6D43_23620 [Candidatus Sericytochromatia bacterium]